MKKFTLIIMILAFGLSVYAADNYKLAEVIGIEYGSIILEVEDNDLKADDKVMIEPAGSIDGTVTAIENSLVTLAVDNNGFAKGSKVLVKNSKKFGRLGAKKAEVKSVNIDSIVLDVSDNPFKVKDTLNISADGERFGKVKSVDKNIVTLSIKNTGYAEGSIVFIKKSREKFEERRK